MVGAHRLVFLLLGLGPWPLPRDTPAVAMCGSRHVESGASETTGGNHGNRRLQCRGDVRRRRAGRDVDARSGRCSGPLAWPQSVPVTVVNGAIRYHVSGRVQGVGFRAFVAAAARAEGLAGSVTNLPDGRVQVHAEGHAEALTRLEARLWHGPPMARVDDVGSEEVVPRGVTDFRIA